LKQAQIILQPDDIVISVDPGGTTGIFVAKYRPDLPSRFEPLYSSVIGFADVEIVLLRLLKKWRPALVVVELFVLYEEKAEDLVGHKFPSVEVIGILRAYCYLMSVPMKRQPASSMSRVEIEEEHTPLVHDSEHARDAYKHARYFILGMHRDVVKLTKKRASRLSVGDG
jgi:hypothetical protein